MKQNIFIYGDSFSEKWESVNKNQLRRLYYNSTNEKPIHFSDIISNEFKIGNVYNYSKSGLDNYSIFENICKSFNDIKPNDIVIVQWSSILRYRFVDNNQWIISSSVKNKINVVNQQNERNCDIVLYELENWMNLLKKVLPIKTIFWTPNVFLYKKMVCHSPNSKIETIYDSNPNIKDLHFSYRGMNQLGNWLCKKLSNLNNNKLV